MAITTQQATLTAKFKQTSTAQQSNRQTKAPLFARWQMQNGRLVCRWTQQA